MTAVCKLPDPPGKATEHTEPVTALEPVSEGWQFSKNFANRSSFQADTITVSQMNHIAFTLGKRGLARKWCNTL